MNMDILTEVPGLSDIVPAARLQKVRQKYFWLRENEWLKAEGHIERYKSNRTFSDLSGDGFDKILWRILKPLIEGVFENQGPWTVELSKSHPGRFILSLQYNDVLYRAYAWEDLGYEVTREGALDTIGGFIKHHQMGTYSSQLTVNKILSWFQMLICQTHFKRRFIVPKVRY